MYTRSNITYYSIITIQRLLRMLNRNTVPEHKFRANTTTQRVVFVTHTYLYS